VRKEDGVSLRFSCATCYAKTDEVLGVHMIGARCADFDTEAVCFNGKTSAEDISRMSRASYFAEASKLPWLQIMKQYTYSFTIFTLKKPVKLYLMGFLFKILEVSI
jgi:hypothetical protein